MKYIVNADFLPEEIEADSLERAEQIVLDSIDIQEYDVIMGEEDKLTEIVSEKLDKIKNKRVDY